MNKHRHLFYSLLFGWLMLASCQPNPSPILKKALQMKNISTDSVLFYLQQITQPENIPAKERGDYYLLSYEAALSKTGTPNDSLLQLAIRHYERNKQTSKCLQARVAQSSSYLYLNQPDSILSLTNTLLKDTRLSDTLKIQLYGLRRAAYYRKGSYSDALAMADSSRQAAHRTQDVLSYFSASQMYFQLLEKMQEFEKYTLGYQQLMEELSNSPEYQHLNYYILEELLNTSLQRKDFRQALSYLQQLSRQRRSRHVVPQYLLLCGKTHAALNQNDSAIYYYQQAAASSSDYIAMEANSLLFKLVNDKEYPEKAFYIKQKENTIKQNILSNIKTEIQKREFNEIKLKNELYRLHLLQQQKELWTMGVVIILLSIGFISFFFYQREKKKRLRRDNQLLHKETELSKLREKEISLKNKETELREALFRRISFFHKLPSLHSNDTQDDIVRNRKITITDAEWSEVTSVVNDAFDNFVVRLQQAYPQLENKDIGFCCLVKININIQDLSDIYCVSKAAITKRKYRIKTNKLGVTDENISLDSFLKTF